MIERARPPTVLSIEPDAPFARTLVRYILRQVGDDPAQLASAIIFIPTQRGRAAIETAFLNELGGRPSLLPSIYPLGDVADLAEGLSLSLYGEALDAKPIISEGKRRALLMGLIERWAKLAGMGRRDDDSRSAIAPAQAWRLAGQLGSLLDEFTRHSINTSKLNDLVVAEHASHWQQIIGFLKIITDVWPDLLESRGEIDRTTAEEKALRLLADRLAAGELDSPIFAAGSTGTRPSVRRLLAVIARLDKGHVILPGLEQDMADSLWDHLPSDHPQWLLRQLLDAMHATRHQVQLLEAEEFSYPDRVDFLRQSMIPAKATVRWSVVAKKEQAELQAHDRRANKQAMTRGLRLAVANNRREEASIIAVAIRQVLETRQSGDKPAPTVALITPDRTLAEEVRAALTIWNITCDDSAGQAARLTLPGRLLECLAVAASENFAPVPLLALLQHPLVSCGERRASFRSFVRTLDKYVLRGVRPKPGLTGIRAAIGRALADDRNPITPETLKAWDRVAARLQPFSDLISAPAVEPAKLLHAHVAACEALAATDSEEGISRLWVRDAGRAIAQHLRQALDDMQDAPAIAPVAYAAFFEAVMDDCTVRPSWRSHPRVAILGQIEARMQSADLTILAGLNAGTWPADLPADPWMNSRMRQTLGLPPADNRIALALHDFLMAASGPEVLLTRAEKIDGTPTVPSRILYRMEAYLGEDLPRADDLVALVRRFNQPRGPRVRAKPPAPRPPLDARPNRLAVTDIERWMRDPYALYARKILGLRPLNPVDQIPSAADKGIILHKALEVWVENTLNTSEYRTSEAGFQDLLSAGRAAFQTVSEQPAVRAFWWPRFKRLADWVIKDGKTRWQDQDTIAVETYGEWTVPGTTFTVFATADRIDRRKADGAYVVIDYKTGNVPDPKPLAAGFRPQMPLEGVILENGGFGDIGRGTVCGLEFWPLKGDAKEPDIKPIKDPADRMADAAEGVARLVTAFKDPETPYLSKPRPTGEAAHQGPGDYDHLARIAEWRGNLDEGGDH